MELTDEQRRIVELIDAYYQEPPDGETGRVSTVRELIADDLDLSTWRVRTAIRQLCAEYGCRTRDLPAAVAAATRGE
jgi:hypothetical protein